MANNFLKRDFPDIDESRIQLRQSRRLSLALFAVTHGLWLVVCVIALALSINDARPQAGASFVAGLDLEIR